MPYIDLLPRPGALLRGWRILQPQIGYRVVEVNLRAADRGDLQEAVGNIGQCFPILGAGFQRGQAQVSGRVIRVGLNGRLEGLVRVIGLLRRQLRLAHFGPSLGVVGIEVHGFLEILDGVVRLLVLQRISALVEGLLGVLGNRRRGCALLVQNDRSQFRLVPEPAIRQADLVG